MNSNNTMRKSVQLIPVIALIVGVSGCATQPTGGSKLGHEEVMQQVRNDDSAIRVCDQYGGRMSCNLEDREGIRKQFDNLQESLRQ